MLVSGLAVLGCAQLESNCVVPTPPSLQSNYLSLLDSKQVTSPNKAEVSPVPAEQNLKPAYAQMRNYPIDLATVIQLVSENSPIVEFSRAKVQEAETKLEHAEKSWIPNLAVGAGYNRFDGQTQNQRGDSFSVSRSNLFLSGGPVLSVDFAEAYYRPLIERRNASAEQLRNQATLLGAELEAVLAFYELVQLHALIEINNETSKNAEGLLVAAKNAKETNLDRTAGDVNRAQTEVLFRRIERLDLEGKSRAASARLGKLLLLDPQVRLYPAIKSIAPVELIEPSKTLEEILEYALSNRPDLAAGREMIQAAWQRVRKAEKGMLLPKLAINNQLGSFGAGRNDDLADFQSRNALSAQLYWEVKHLGFTYQAEVSERQALMQQVSQHALEVQARATAEIVESAQLAAARYESLELAEQAVKEAKELYRINMESMTNAIDPKNLVDALRPLQALQAYNQARTSYLTAVIEFNKAQYRLFTASGYPKTTTQPSAK